MNPPPAKRREDAEDAEARIAARAREVAATFPPLTGAQRERLAELLERDGPPGPS